MTLSATSNALPESLFGSTPRATRSARLLLSIRLSEGLCIININKEFFPPVSWFLTDKAGEMVAFGHILDRSETLDLTQIPKGTFALRIAGEVYVITN